MTLREKMNEILEDFDESHVCPSSYSLLQGHYVKNIWHCDSNCYACWNQPYIDDNEIVTAVQEGL